MTYAIIESGNKQYRVKAGDQIQVEKLAAAEGSLAIKEVLLVSDGAGKVAVGKPYVEGAVVKTTVMGVEKGPKLISFKFKRKTGYHKTIGHRQQYTRLKIEAVEGI